jgi:hypothetical protein
MMLIDAEAEPTALCPSVPRLISFSIVGAPPGSARHRDPGRFCTPEDDTRSVVTQRESRKWPDVVSRSAPRTGSRPERQRFGL